MLSLLIYSLYKINLIAIKLKLTNLPRLKPSLEVEETFESRQSLDFGQHRLGTED